FQYVAGYDIDERIKTTVDNLAEVFRATNVEDLLKNLGKATHNNDPIIHFYETFLAEYDPKLRKARGVWYTPEPVVNFIVRAVDDLLKSEFGLKDGLADTSKTTIQVEAQGTAIAKGKNKGKAVVVNQEVHKVQILDPATGTGTFLAEVVKFIYNKKFKTMQGAWSGYVEDHLIPRLNGFELLMASYSMAHLKLDMLLAATGYKAKKEQRFNIFLTNSLEEHHPDTGTLFSTWLSSEANEANQIKRDTPVMVVMGNPPYSVSSSNKGEWIGELIRDYKKDLNEKKLNLDDDYIKFIRYGQHFIDKNGEGILAYISNNSFLDGITHRQMRKSLLESFDRIYILDLHGNAKKKETAPDGSKDENVFDIMQGVSINIFVKTNSKNQCSQSEVFHFDLFGLRKEKYGTLFGSEFESLEWSRLGLAAPNYFFVPKNYDNELVYREGFQLNELIQKYSTGIETKCDDISVTFSKGEIDQTIKNFIELGKEELFNFYRRKKSPGWNYNNAKEDLKNNNPKILSLSYRPFDIRKTAYTGCSSGFMGRPRSEVMKHLLRDNVSLCSARSNRNEAHTYFINRLIVDKSIISSLDNIYIFPLYLYPETTDQQTLDDNQQRTPNLNMEIVEQITATLGLIFTTEKEPTENTFAPIDLLDYIYAVLHSPTYREEYKEFLKIDFPRVPYPEDNKTFWQLVRLGDDLRQIHLLESEKVEKYITSYPQDGDNVITRKLNKNDWELYDPENQLGRIWINGSQYFDQIPLLAWEFYIGGYQPAQKWLKDRRKRTLSYDDIRHYQKIIVALTETDRLMKVIDQVIN
ncbi:MAG: N-6 DNA methylase, partial [Thiomicrorhabdus sp.]|nr:N-6 DNA methylase [Thiomicrorhabdus sp.]